MLEQELKALVQEFRTAIYGKDVRRTYADIAELVCVRAMRDLNYAVEKGNKAEQQGNYAKEQGDYAKEQGNYAKEQGDYAGRQADTAVAEINSTIVQMGDEFASLRDALEATENGALLVEIDEILRTHRLATEADVDKIIRETYVDKDDDGGIFETGSTQDIDAIIEGTYVGAEE